MGRAWGPGSGRHDGFSGAAWPCGAAGLPHHGALCAEMQPVALAQGVWPAPGPESEVKRPPGGDFGVKCPGSPTQDSGSHWRCPPAPRPCFHRHTPGEVIFPLTWGSWERAGGWEGVLGAPTGAGEGFSLVARHCALTHDETSPVGSLFPCLPSSPPWWSAAQRRQTAPLPQGECGPLTTAARPPQRWAHWHSWGPSSPGRRHHRPGCGGRK